MTDVASAPAELRDRWRHDLNNAAHRVSVVRESIGVLGVMPGKGSLEGLAADLELAQKQLRAIQEQVEDVIRKRTA